MNEGLAKFLVGLKFLRCCKIYCGNDEASTQWLAFLLSSYSRWRCCSFIIRTTEVTKKVGYRMYHTLRQRQTQHVAWLHWTTLALQQPLCLPLGQGTNKKIVYAYASNPKAPMDTLGSLGPKLLPRGKRHATFPRKSVYEGNNYIWLAGINWFWFARNTRTV